MSDVRMRVAQRDWCASRRLVSVMRRGACSRGAAGAGAAWTAGGVFLACDFLAVGLMDYFPEEVFVLALASKRPIAVNFL